MSAPAPKNLPRHATHRYHTVLVVIGALFLLSGVAGFASVLLFGASSGLLLTAGPVLAVLGGLFVFLGGASLRIAAGVQIVNAAFDLLSRGRLADAEAHLDLAEQGRPHPLIVCVAAVQRGLIAMRRGEIPSALAHLDRALTAPRGLLYRDQIKMHALNARGIRAFLRAASGEREGAREDIEAVRASDDALPQALGRVALAEAILLERAGHRDALREHLVTNHELLFDVIDRRERAIVRAFQRMLETNATSVYRKGAKRDAESEEPPLADWIAQVVPEAAPFVEAGGARPDKTVELATPEATEEAKKAVSAARKQAEGQRPGRAIGRVLGLWALLIGLFVVIWRTLEPAPRTRRGRPVPPPPPSEGLEVMLGALPVLFLVLVFVLAAINFVRGRKQSRALVAANGLVAQGKFDEAVALLGPLTKSRFPLVASQAHLTLAYIAERAVDPAKALEHCDRGLGLLSNYTLRISASDLLLPGLISERAFLLAAMDRHAEAEAELASLPSTYAYRSSSLFRVRLLSCVRQADRKGAAEIAAQAGLDLMLSGRDELLVDTVRAAANPETAGAGEIPRIKRELRTHAPLRRWMETFAPDAVAALDRTAEERPLDAPKDADARAEEEALAEAEAARAASRPVVVSG
ncbi:hypothetical protein [Polyangium sp. 15x6]|uniref:hypothetical protein n=1 Tax=Polyangium sp. 15x6 TaxID=3042687 RepID=UPI00249CBC30|nr:hypothetical protein [Polyangium sp. 15x6]MDI3288396.1 hypothetical protein [Polyangium sp. 15x6]